MLMPWRRAPTARTRPGLGRVSIAAEWAHVLTCLEALPFGPERLRLKCILALHGAQFAEESRYVNSQPPVFTASSNSQCSSRHHDIAA